ncbi:MAG TPA: TonB-dependent receptor [Cryomorphaceae bacterium]|nr:TonB-dependent receptor [Cryomorphaceae bacterium]
MIQKVSSAIAAVMLLFAGANAQTVLKGTVTDENGDPLAGAHVVLEEALIGVFTDDDGKYSFGTVKRDQVTIQSTYLGYEKFSSEIKLASGETSFPISMTPLPYVTDEVVVTATRLAPKAPATFQNIEKKELEKLNFGQDLPFLLNWTPSLVATSDAGAGVGYTGMRIRGSDQTRINVTVNGIPINDSESQGVFWVNMPDLASSLSSIQIQRGLGSSTNGSGAFGASVNLETNNAEPEAGGAIDNSYGSFNTRKHTVEFNSGILNNGFAIEGRLSNIQSDGFIDRASSDLRSYYLAGGYYGKKTMVKAITFSGAERTYQSWYGTPQSRLENDVEGMLQHAANEGYNEEQTQNLLNSGRTYNFYLYENEVDDYQQDHYQLHLVHEFNSDLKLSVAGHYTYGRGFFEQYRNDDEFSDYGLDNIQLANQTLFSNDTLADGSATNTDFNNSIKDDGAEVIGMVVLDELGNPILNMEGDTLLNMDASIYETDLIRRRWLENDFYGATYSLDYSKGGHKFTLGGGLHFYRGDHFGEIVWAEYSQNIDHLQQYYFNVGNKDDYSVYGKWEYATGKWNFMADLQYRRVDYETFGVDNDQVAIDVSRNFNFFNPKVGARYDLNSRNAFYVYLGRGNREPVRNDFIDALEGTEPEAETLNNLELGYTYKTESFQLNLNGYAMIYENQLVLTGELNDVGSAIRRNVDDSYRLGIEADATVQVAKNLWLNANLTLSRNRIGRFDEVVYDYTNGFDVLVNEFEDTDISFSPEVISAGRLIYQPLEGLEFMLISKYVGDQYLDNTSNEAKKIDAYWVNDFRIGYKIKDVIFKEIEISLLVNNILDAEYSSNGYTYSYVFGSPITENFFYPQAGTNFLAGLRLSF